MFSRRHVATAGIPFVAVLAAGISMSPIAAQEEEEADPVADLVARLTLDDYKATLKGLTRFGDRRQGTQRNRDAVDWIEAWLQDAGCTNTERVHYTYAPRRFAEPPRRAPGQTPARRTPPRQQVEDLTTATGGLVGRRGRGAGGSTIFGYRGRTGVNRGLMAQPDERIRELNREEPVDGDRSQVYCTKVGTTHPDEMYILGAHMDGHGVNEAVDDDGSGTALVMELARVFSSPDVETERSIRFILWNNEETGLNGARAYVEQRQELQGVEDPPGSGQYPEPQMAGDDPARHDALGPRGAGPRRPGQPRPTSGGRRQHRIPVELGYGPGVDEPGVPLQVRERALRHRLPGRRRPPHDQHRLHALHEPRRGDQPA